MTERTDDMATGGTPVEEMTYTDASRELDDIVSFFEQRDVDVDQLVGRLVRATALIEELDRRLRQTKMQVEQLVPRLAAVRSDGPPGEPTASDEFSARADDQPWAGAGSGEDEPDGDDLGGATPELF
jgi:exonuclease VII small subunit